MTDGVATTVTEGRGRGLKAWLDEQAGHFRDDVVRRPTIGPVASWLILGLVALVGWLTTQYAPGAATGAACRTSAQQAAASGGVIPVDAGYGTVIAVTAITLIAGMQPLLERRFAADWSGQMSDWFARQPLVLRAPIILVSRVLGVLLYVPAWLLSFGDYLLARPIALSAGAGLSPFWLRYGVFLAWMASTIAAAWLLSGPLGLWGFFFGVALVIGVARRWSWVEADREAFFVARRKQNERIGFAEDLRDEALVALVFLFVLIPLGLRQIELMRSDTFCINGGSGADAGVLAWLGFFGAELAKSVPFVDWSEVFHVANGSPIQPHTVLGAQIVFAMRATLDLLMIAAVVQAVQLATRLAEQNTAFAAGDIDILEPFVERTRFHALGMAIDRAGVGKVVEQERVVSFPAYSPVRLEQIVKGGGDGRAVQAPADPAARRAALALAAKQAVGVGRPEEATTLIHVASHDPVEANRQMAVRLAAESVPNALMAPAYTEAKEIVAKGGAVDVSALLQDYPEQARPLAQRAIRSAMGELDVMVPIRAGQFMMGAPEGEDGSRDAERPRHPVSVAAFEIGKYPVTFEEFDAFCEATGYWCRAMGADRPEDIGWGRGRRPVINVSWLDAQEYIRWLNAWSDGGFRLPSEAEWEYACRAGTTTRWSFGDDEGQLGEYGWFDGNASPPVGEGETHPVGEKLPNSFGIYDMHGNVSEWVEDHWHDSYEGAPEDGSVWAEDNNRLRVLRGGSWYSGAQLLRSANRDAFDPSVRYFFHGFRLARTV